MRSRAVLLTILVVLLASCAGRLDLTDYYRIPTDFEGNRLSDQEELIASNEVLELYLTESTGAITVIDKRSGMSWRSNPAETDSSASPLNRNLMTSQIAITYFTPNAKAAYINSAEAAAQLGQITYEPIENGVRAVYTLGEVVEIELIPLVIERSRFEEFFERVEDPTARSHIDRQYKLYSLADAHTDAQRERMLEKYPQLDEYDVYEYSGFENRGIRAYIESGLASAGYTIEDLNYDHCMNNVPEEEQNPRIYSMTMEYRIEGDALVVTVPGAWILGHPQYPLTNFRFLSYFGAAPEGTDGYMLVPDGQGALIRFDNGKLYSPSYITSVYGYDPSDPPNEFIGRPLPTRLPVFGIKQGDNAFVAVIEEGASLSRILADVSGRTSMYNTVGPEFFFRPYAPVELESLQGNKDVNVYQQTGYQGDYVLRYTFLTGDDADYVGMADVVRQRLMNERVERPQVTDYPLFVDIYGAIDTVKQFIGIPYRGVEPLTTFDQARELIADLRTRGAPELVVRYMGWLDGGVYHDAAPGAGIENRLGGRNDLQELASVTGAEVYFDLSLTRVMINKLFDGFTPFRETARFLDREPAFQRRYDMASFIPNLDDPGYFLLAPGRLVSDATRVLQRADRFGASRLSFRYLGQTVHSDFRERNELDREEALAESLEALRLASEQTDGVMLEGASGFALPYADAIVGVPDSSSGHRLLDESIPFYQMVVRGSADYAGDPVNLGETSRRAFLRTLESGASPRFALIAEDNAAVIDTDHSYLFSVGADVWSGVALDWYRELSAALGPVAGEPIIDHVIDGDLRVITYGSGRRIVVNYGNPFEFEGEMIGEEDYRVYD